MTQTPKEEAEELLNALLSFAQQQLEKYGEFFPFGAVMLTNGEIQLASNYIKEEHPSSQAVINDIKSIFIQKAKDNSYKATGLAYNFIFSDSQNGEKRDGVCVELDHKNDYSVIVIFPYAFKQNNQVEFLSPVASKGKGEIFK